MRIVSIAARRVRWPIEPRGAARTHAVREAILVELRDEDGNVGLGEAAPLPGVSTETIDDAERAIAEFAARLRDRDATHVVPCPFESGTTPPGVSSPAFSLDSQLFSMGLGVSSFAGLTWDRRFEVSLATFGGSGGFYLAKSEPQALRSDAGADVMFPSTSSPAARFAFETALLAIADVHADIPAPPRSAVVVDTLDEASAAVANGATVLKLKVGPGLDLALVRAVAAIGVTLRLDANRSWSFDEARHHLAQLVGLPVEYVEEPCVDARRLLGESTLIALDESLVDDRTVDARLAAVILKPTLLGGFAACLELAAHARAAGVAAIVTHALEGPIGTAACARLASMIGGDRAVGLAPHPALAGWELKMPATLADVVAANPALAPSAARGIAVVTASEQLDFGSVVARATQPIRSVVATPEVATIAAIYAALEAREPIALHHHRLAEGELDRQRTQLANVPRGTAVVLFTSGSTKAARGVALSRDALLAACEASALGWREDDRWLLALSVAHAGGLAVVVRCLAARKPVVMLEGDFDAARVARMIVDQRVTIASLVPAQLAALLDDPGWSPPDHLRAVLLGGAAASPALLEAAADAGVPFLVTYGMTETFGQIATARYPGGPLVPLPGVTIIGGTPEHPTPLRIRGAMLATAYLDGTPIAPELVTSDLGYVDDAVHIAGRADDVIITGGENVHPLSVEAVVAATPGVRAVCAFGVPDERWGQVVAVALSVEPSFEIGVAAAHWRAALPSHARPRRIAIVAALPVLATGKPDRRGAAQLATRPIALS